MCGGGDNGSTFGCGPKGAGSSPARHFRKELAMDSEDKFWLGFWAITGATIVAVVISLCLFVLNNNKQAFDAGYERGTIVNVAEGVWVKTKQ